jgi:hypothetical protein
MAQHLRTTKRACPHVAAEFGQARAAQLLLDYGADVTLLDSENDAIGLDGRRFSVVRES